MELGSDHVDSRHTTVAKVMAKIIAHSDLCAVGVPLLQAKIYTDSHERDIAFAVVWKVLASDENDSVSTVANSGGALSKMSKFFV